MFGKTLARPVKIGLRVIITLAAVIVAGVLIWQGVTAAGNPDPTVPHLSTGAAIVDTGVLVFREGLECILVLSAITASMMGLNQSYRRPVAAGAGLGFVATIITWFVVVGIVADLSQNISALSIQAWTGLLAIIVLVIIMNWFFHKVYWTGWISLQNRRKRTLLTEAHSAKSGRSGRNIFWGLALLGFASFYREGFEVVLFLQNLRLEVGSLIVLYGVLAGLVLTSVVGVVTFIAHHKMPYKRMLVLTGVMLGVVMLVMVGEEAQEMQLAGWISTTNLSLPIPDWLGLWFSVFPTVETLLAQAIAAVLVLGSYFIAEYMRVWRPRRRGEIAARRAEAAPVADSYQPQLVSAGLKNDN